MFHQHPRERSERGSLAERSEASARGATAGSDERFETKVLPRARRGSAAPSERAKVWWAGKQQA